MNTTYIEVDTSPIFIYFLINQCFIVMRVHIAQIVSAGTCKARHGIQFKREYGDVIYLFILYHTFVYGVPSPFGSVSQRWFSGFGRKEFGNFRQFKRQTSFVDHIRHSILVVNRERLAPVALAAEQPVAQTVADGALADAGGFEPGVDLGDGVVHAQAVEASGGMPVGCNGAAVTLLSGGIDSPVAAWCMARRGLALHHIHFASPPYTSLRAKLKVRALARELAEYTGNCQLFVVPYTKPQEYIRDNAPDVLFTVLMRRSMLRIAKLVADQSEMEALITGESLAQVASQTMQAIACTDAAQNLPILRPLIGMDKTEIIETSRHIGTYETSILPYEDCCTIFTPPHPKTKPHLDEIEAALDDANVVRFAQYLRRVSDKTQFIVITHRRGTMEAANVLYGVTMQEDGVSKLLKLDLEQVDATLVS